MYNFNFIFKSKYLVFIFFKINNFDPSININFDVTYILNLLTLYLYDRKLNKKNLNKN